MTNRDRFERPINLVQFSQANPPLRVGIVDVTPPREEQKVLRMLVQSPYSGGLQVPEELQWLRGPIARATNYQREKVGVRHPYTYITVRHGLVTTRTDDLWHVDGFSMKYHHLPEANYLFTFGDQTTEYAEQSFDFPSDFDPLRHNVHLFFQRRVKPESIRRLHYGTMYMMDPYVVHRRPPDASGWRTFVRISFTPIEIPDVNNTTNHLIPTAHYSVDGVKGFRNQLLDYDSV